MKCLSPGLALTCTLALFSLKGTAQEKKDSVPRGPGYLVEQSKVLAGIEWLEEARPYKDPDGDTAIKGDTYPLTWAGNDTIYTSAGDPLWGAKRSGMDVEAFAGGPTDYKILKVNEMMDYTGSGGCGLKPAGLISINNVLYMTVQNMTGPYIKYDRQVAELNHGYDASIVYSTDFGKTWMPDIKKDRRPYFPGRIFASPTIVNFGKDNAGAVDDYVYVISGEGWCNGDHCRLGRVHKDRIMQRDAWEWVSGFKEGFEPVWTKKMFDATEILTDEAFLGYSDMVYIAKLKRYLLLTWHFNGYSDPNAGSKIAIYESPKPWGPFSLVYKADWETPEKTPYSPRIPLKWFDQDKLEGYLLFSGTWRNGGQTEHYRAHVRKFRLLPAK